MARRTLSDYERACYRALGQIMSHTLEATGRTLRQGESEREVAGQIGQRMRLMLTPPELFGSGPTTGRSKWSRHFRHGGRPTF